MYKSKISCFLITGTQNRVLFLFLIFFASITKVSHAQGSIFEVWNQTNNSTVFTVNAFRSVSVDKRGIVWVGSDLGGLYKFDGESWEKFPYLTGNSFRQMETSPIVADSNLWTVSIGFNGVQATTGGVYYMRSQENTALHYGSGIFGGLGSRYANSFVISNNVIYVALAQSLTGTTTNQGGIYKMSIVNPQQQTATSFSIAFPEPAGDIVYHSAGKRNNELWFGRGATCSGGCVAPRITRLDANGQPLSSITASNSPLPFTATNTSPVARAIFTDTITGNTYVGLSGGAGIGVMKADGSWKMLNTQNANYPAGASVNFNAINEVYGEIWFGTTHGIFIYNTSESLDSLKSFSLLTTEDGLPTNGVSDIAVDTMRGEIWVTTFAGVARMGRTQEGIKGTLFDVQLNNSIKKDTVVLNGSLKKKALITGVSLELYEGNSMVDTQEPDENGNFIFTETEPGHSYKLLVRKPTGKGDIMIEYPALAFDSLVGEILVPDSLIKEIDHFRQYMEKRCFPAKMPLGWNSDLLGGCRDGFLMNNFYTAVNQFYEGVEQEHKKSVENLANYYLAMITLYDLGGSSAELIGEAWLSALNLMEYVISQAKLGEKLFSRKDKFKSFEDKQMEAQLSLFVNTIKIRVESYIITLRKKASLLPAGSEERKTMDKFISNFDDAMGMILLYLEKGGVKFSITQVVEIIKRAAVAQGTAMSYKEYAQVRHMNSISTASNAALNLKSGISYSNAFGQLYNPGSGSLIFNSNSTANTAKSNIESLRSASKITEATGEIIDAVSIVSIFAGPVAAITTRVLAATAKVVRIGLGSSEVLMGVMGSKIIENNSDQVLTKSELKSSYKIADRTFKSGTNIFLSDHNPATLESLKNIYNQRLGEYKSAISQPTDSLAFWTAFSNLSAAEINYFNSISKNYNSIWEAADSANQVIGGWGNKFDHSVDSINGKLLQLRTEFYWLNLSYMIDSNNAAYMPELPNLIDSIIATNNQNVIGIQDIATDISDFGITTPANLIKDEFTLNFSGNPGDNGSFSYIFTNYGMVPQQGVSMKVEDMDGGFSLTSPDSVFLGTIPAGASKQVSFTFSAPNMDTIGKYSLKIGAVNGLVPYITGSIIAQSPAPEVSFISLKDGLWSDPSTWSTGEVPTADDIVVINNHVTVNLNSSCKSLKTNPGGRITVSPGIKLDISN